MRFLLMAAGAITIIVAVMMALVQHDCRKLLGFHAVSQVGYMVLGFGLSSAIGVAAAFSTYNNALYKSGLFLSAGCVEYRTEKKTIDELGASQLQCLLHHFITDFCHVYFWRSSI